MNTSYTHTPDELREEARQRFIAVTEAKFAGNNREAYEQGMIARRYEQRADEIEAAGLERGSKYGPLTGKEAMNGISN